MGLTYLCLTVKTIRSFFLFLSFIALAMPCSSQSRILSGTIADVVTKEAIPYAAISFKNSFSGTAANESGFYQINISSDYEKDSLQFSFLGYSRKVICVKDIKTNDSIFLNRNDFQLNEIVVRPNLPTFYIKEALKGIKRNYPKTPFETQAYFREIFKENSNYITCNEAVFKSYYPNYQDTIKNQHQLYLYRKINDVKKLAFMQEERDKRNKKNEKKKTKNNAAKPEPSLIPEEERAQAYDNFGGPEQILRSANITRSDDYFLDSTKFKDFEYSFAPSTTYENRELIVIDFKSKGKVDNVKSTGKIFIDAQTDAFVKIEYSGVYYLPFIYKPVLALYGLSIGKPTFTLIKEFQEQDGFWYPKQIRFNVYAELEKSHWFEPDEQSTFNIEEIFFVNTLKSKGAASIPEAKRFTSKKKIEIQVKNDINLNWNQVNTLK